MLNRIIKWDGWIWNDPEGPLLPSRLPPSKSIMDRIRENAKRQDDVTEPPVPEAFYDRVSVLKDYFRNGHQR